MSTALAPKTPGVEPHKAQIEQAIKTHAGVISRVAREFGISRQALYRRIEKYEINTAGG